MKNWRKLSWNYHQIPFLSVPLKNCCDYPKIWIVWFYNTVMYPENADKMANIVDPDQMAPWGAERSSLIGVYAVCSDMSVSILGIIIVEIILVSAYLIW